MSFYCKTRVDVLVLRGRESLTWNVRGGEEKGNALSRMRAPDTLLSYKLSHPFVKSILLLFTTAPIGFPLSLDYLFLVRLRSSYFIFT